MTWRPSPQPPCEPGCTCRGSFVSENDRLAEYVRAEHGRELTDPRAIPHPEGGVTYPVDPTDPEGERLHAYWALDPDPVPGGGDRLPGHGKTRPLKREPGGVESSGSSSAPKPPMSTSDGSGTLDSPPVLARPSAGFRDDRVSAQSHVQHTPGHSAGQTG